MPRVLKGPWAINICSDWRVTPETEAAIEVLISSSHLPASQQRLSLAEHNQKTVGKEIRGLSFADSQLQNYKIQLRRVSGLGLRDNREMSGPAGSSCSSSFRTSAGAVDGQRLLGTFMTFDLVDS